jgi:formylglycine-generating enzyme required for sulfatase activity
MMLARSKRVGWLIGCLLTAGFSSLLAAAEGPPKESLAKDGVPMTLVPAGEFWMGLSESAGLDDEQPRHRVFLDAYYIDHFEVTVERFAKFLDVTGWEKPANWNLVKLPEHADRPVIGVSWNDADAYCRINGRRLPTEAEWEKAARGTNERKYPWGDTKPNPTLAYFGQGARFSYDILKPVGSYPTGAGPYGTMDLAGNVAEWVQDWYDGEYYRDSPERNPPGPMAGQYRMVRGGSWSDLPVYLLSASRTSKLPSTTRNAFIGFRCAQNAK